MAENKVCPHCGGHMFMAKITKACVVEIVSDKTDVENPYKVLKENNDKFDIELLKCARCKEDVTEADLTEAVECKECGSSVNPSDINKDGICRVCAAKHERSELANASNEDLIRMLLDAEKKINSVANKMEKQIEKAEEAEAANEAEEKPAEKKTKRRVVKKKKTTEEPAAEPEEAKPEEPVVEENKEDVPEVDANAVNELANQQDAPFPDVAGATMPTDTPEEPVAEEVKEVQSSIEPSEKNSDTSEDQPLGSDFKMFDEEDIPF